MLHRPIVIEFAGIPYSKKTSTINQLAKMLGERRIPFVLVEEYLGSPDFYDAAKMTADVNFARMLDCAKDLIFSSYDQTTEVVLIDRGIFDTYCWFKWFQSNGKLSEGMLESAATLLKVSQYYSSKYKAIWLDTEPVIAASRHGHQGRIVNLNNLAKLQVSYSKAVDELSSNISIHRIDSDKVSSFEIAEKSAHLLKLW